MAGSSMTFTYDDGRNGDGISTRYRRVAATWLSDDATGSVTGTTRKVVGKLVKAVTDPGTPAPSANYDIALTDDASADILGNTDATLANRHTTNSETVVFLEKSAAAAAMAVHPVVVSPITIAVTNAGNAKAGVIYLYFEV